MQKLVWTIGMPTKTSLSLEKEQIERLSRFVDSPLYNCGSDDLAKSGYWRYHSQQLVTEIDRTSGVVSASGEAGFYVPTPGSFAKKAHGRCWAQEEAAS